MGYIAAAKLIGGGIILLVILGVCGHYVYNYEHWQTQIKELQDKNAGLELGQADLKKNAEEFKAFMAKKQSVARRIPNEQADISKEVADPNADLDPLYLEYRLQRIPGKVPATKSRGGSSPSHRTSTPP